MAEEVRRFVAGDGREFKSSAEADDHDRWLRWRAFCEKLGLLGGESDAELLWAAREEVFSALEGEVTPPAKGRRITVRVVPPDDLRVADAPGAVTDVYDVGATVRSLRGLEGVFPSPEKAAGYAGELRGIGAEGVVVVPGGVRLGVLRCADPDSLGREAVEHLSLLVKQGTVHQLFVLPAGGTFELYEEVPGGDAG